MQVTVLLSVFLESKSFTHLHDVNNPAVFFTYIQIITKSTSRQLRVKNVSSLAISVIIKLVG